MADRTFCNQCGTEIFDEPGDTPPEQRKPCPKCGSKSRRLEASAHIVFKSTMTATANMKHHFSRQHLSATRLFAYRASEIEKAISVDTITEEQRTEHRAYVTAGVISGVAFLDSWINELYLSARDNTIKALNESQLRAISELWEVIENSPVLKKYHSMLAVCGAQTFEKNDERFRQVEALIMLRDALVHYRPEWDDKQNVHQKVRDRLKGRFELNPYGAGLWFPHQCLGAGCALWTIQTVEQFMADFCERIKIEFV